MVVQSRSPALREMARHENGEFENQGFKGVGNHGFLGSETYSSDAFGGSNDAPVFDKRLILS